VHTYTTGTVAMHVHLASQIF